MTLNQTEGSGPVLFVVKVKGYNPSVCLQRAGSVWFALALVTKTSKQTNHCAKVVSTTLVLCYVKQCEAKQQTHRKQDKPRLAALC